MNKTLEQRSFLLILAVVSLLFLWLIGPFFEAVFWACIIGLLFRPLQDRLLASRWIHRPGLAALATLLVCILIGVLPVLFVLTAFFQQGANLYQRIQSGEVDPGTWLARVREAFPWLQELLARFDIDIGGLEQQFAGIFMTGSGLIAQNALSFGLGTLQFFVQLAVCLYVAYFMLRDGRRLVDLLIRALPLGDARERLLLTKFAEVVRATIKGNLLIAVLQGSLGGLIFWALGLANPLLWGVVMALMSLIPALGAGLIWAPVAIYLLASGAWVKALILTAFGAGVIGLVDNLLRPIVVGRDTKLPDYLVLLSTLGGFVLFGINGFVIGPIIAALFIAVWEIFIREFNEEGGGPPPARSEDQ